MKYQDNFSETLIKKEEYLNSRKLKAEKILSVISDHYNGELSQLKVLEIGCFTGVISSFLAPYFKTFYAIDIDEQSLKIARENNSNNVFFESMSADLLNYETESFDVVICSHVYEHVPDPVKMMEEIHRVLKKNGICYFAAGNKIALLDPEYNLLFASMLPKNIANKYVKLFRNIPQYYETFMLLPQLQKLVNKFKRIDYTKKILNDPHKFHINGILKKNSTVKKIICTLVNINFIYFIFPTYIWVLKKE